MAVIGVTDMADARADVISQLVQETIAERSQLLPLVTRYDAPAGMKQLTIPRRGIVSASELDGEGDAEVSASAFSFSGDDIILKQYAARCDVSDMAKLSSPVNVEEEVIKELGASLARQIDDIILTELTTTGNYSLAAHKFEFDADGTGTEIIKGDVLKARRLLRVNGAIYGDDGQTFCVCHPQVEESLLQIADFVDASKYGSNVPVQRGELGTIFGVKFISHADLNNDQAVVFHRSAVGLAMQKDYSLEYFRDVKSLNDVYTGSMVAGAKMLSEGKRAVLMDESP